MSTKKDSQGLRDDDDYWNDTQFKNPFDFDSDDFVPLSKLGKPFTGKNEDFEKSKDNVLFSAMLGNVDRGDDWTPDKSVFSARYRENSVTSLNDPGDQLTSKFPATRVAKLESQIQHLKRHTQEIPSLSDIIDKIINDDYYSLERFRSRELKVAFLKAAIDSHDGNAILRAVLHLKHNTKPSIFQYELRSKPEAIEHYLAYLRLHSKYQELIDVLGMFGRSEEAAMVTYQMAIANSKPETTVKLMQSCLRSHFYLDPNLSREALFIQEHINLLEKQLPIEKDDAQLEREGKTEIFQKIPRSNPLPRQSVLDTFYYCCLYHFDLKENYFASPFAISKEFRLGTKQFTYSALSAFAELEDWKRMDSLILTKNYLGNTKLKSDLNMGRICEILSSKNAPVDALKKFISYVEDHNQRLELAKRYKCHDVVIDTLTKMKDRQQLYSYKSKLPAQSGARLTADTILRQSIKWKN